MTPGETRIYIGCAGWSISSASAALFPDGGTHLMRYASVFPAVEINSSFYRPHLPQTYARWRDSVPLGFRFSVKLPRTITHQARLLDTQELISGFVRQVDRLEDKLGCLLVQLPPSLAFDRDVVRDFFTRLRELISVPVVCEARHPSWFTETGRAALAELGISQVLADPPAGGLAALPTAQGIAYFRLHGSPHVYHSAYSCEQLDCYLAQICAFASQPGRTAWCIFDNTASGAALRNAHELLCKLTVHTQALQITGSKVTDYGALRC